MGPEYLAETHWLKHAQRALAILPAERSFREGFYKWVASSPLRLSHYEYAPEETALEYLRSL